MNDRIQTQQLQNAIAGLYASPLADFIRARDALAKELRSAGERDAAVVVKGLRKPSRPAWALSRVAHEDPDALSALEMAVAGIVDAQGGNGDVRAAMVALRAAVRHYASQAAHECRTAGFSLDTGDLSNAVLAVLGDPSSFNELRSGRMTEVPAAGGLDFLTSLAARPRLEVSSSASAAVATVDPAEMAAAQNQARSAREALDAARIAADSAAAALAEAEAEAAAAQEKLRAAEAELKAALQRREFARRTRDASNAELRNAEAASLEAERRLRSDAT